MLELEPLSRLAIVYSRNPLRVEKSKKTLCFNEGVDFGFELTATINWPTRPSYRSGHNKRKSLIQMVPMEGVEPTHPYGYQILSLARLPIPPHRLPDYQALRQ